MHHCRRLCGGWHAGPAECGRGGLEPLVHARGGVDHGGDDGLWLDAARILQGLSAARLLRYRYPGSAGGEGQCPQQSQRLFRRRHPALRLHHLGRSHHRWHDGDGQPLVLGAVHPGLLGAGVALHPGGRPHLGAAGDPDGIELCFWHLRPVDEHSPRPAARSSRQ